MKRYLVFYGREYYPDGGMSDFINDFDTIKEAKKCIFDYICSDFSIHEQDEIDEHIRYNLEYNWFHIYDLEKKEIIFENLSSEKENILNMILK